jgi:hypothetical protein
MCRWWRFESCFAVQGRGRRETPGSSVAPRQVCLDFTCTSLQHNQAKTCLRLVFASRERRFGRCGWAPLLKVTGKRHACRMSSVIQVSNLNLQVSARSSTTSNWCAYRYFGPGYKDSKVADVNLSVETWAAWSDAVSIRRHRFTWSYLLQ